MRHFTAKLYATEKLWQSLNCCCVTFSQIWPFEEHWKTLEMRECDTNTAWMGAAIAAGFPPS